MNKTSYAETAQGLASMGRYGDSMLVHMTPGEVAGLQALAMQHGTSLTINPKTGLPEAFILAPLIGAGLGAFTAMSPLAIGLTTGLLGWAVTGDLGQGIMAGLGGAGGAGLGGALGKFGAAQAATPTVTNVATTGASLADDVAAGALGGVGKAVTTPGVMGTGTLAGMPQGYAGIGGGVMGGAPTVSAAPAIADLGGKTTAFGTSSGPFGDLVTGAGAALKDPMAFYKAFPDEALTAAGMAATPLITSALQPPQFAPPVPEEKTPYEGPYFPTERVAQFPTTQDILAGSNERQYFEDVHPYPGFEPRRMANGGQILETPDGIGQNVQLSRNGYGLGALASRPVGFAPGGEIDYGITSTAGGATDPNSIPSVGFTERLAAYDKQLADLTKPRMPAYGQWWMNPGGALNPFQQRAQDQFGQGLTREQAIAQLGARPVWNPESIAPRVPVQQPTPQPVGGGGVTELPVRPPQMASNPAMTGFQNMASGIMGMAKGGYLDGAGDGMSDSIPATIGGKQPARLADGEFVIPADVVSHLGNGSTKAGAKRLYAMMDKVRQARTGTKKQGKQIKPEKYMPA